MARKHKPEDIIGKLCEAEIVLAQGRTVSDACRGICVAEQIYCRLHKECGDLKMDQGRLSTGLHYIESNTNQLVSSFRLARHAK